MIAPKEDEVQKRLGALNRELLAMREPDTLREKELYVARLNEIGAEIKALHAILRRSSPAPE